MAIARRGLSTQRLARRAHAGILARRVQPRWLALSFVVFAALAVRLTWWYGVVNVDPYAYADSAESIARWQPAFDPDLVGSLYYTQYIRFSLTVPAAVLYRLFGPGEAVSTIVPIAASLGTVLIAARLAWREGGAPAGIIAAALAGFFPLAVINSTQFLPDTMMTFFATLATLAFLEGLDARRPRSRRTWFLVAGAAFALAFYGRPTAVALLPVFGVLFALRRPWRPDVLAAIPGSLAVFAAVQILLLSLGGAPFEDLHTLLTEGRGDAPGALHYTDMDFSYARYLLQDHMFLPFTLLAAGALVLGLSAVRRPRNRRVYELAALVLGQYLYFEFLMRLPGLPSWWKEPRYAMSMFVPAFALAAIAAAAWLRSLTPPSRLAAMAWVAGALALYAALAIDAVRDDHATWEQMRVGRTEADLAAFLAGQPTAPIYTWNDDIARYLSFHVGLEHATVYDRAHNRGLVRNRFDPEGRSLVAPGSFVLVEAGQEAAGITAVAPEWQLAWESGDLRLYRVPG